MASFWQTDATGADFRNIDGAAVAMGTSKVDGVSFAGSKLRYLECLGVDLTSVDLSLKDKNLRNAWFQNVVMTGKDFSGFDFSGADFECTGPVVGGPYARGDATKSTNMVAGADFRGAKFTGANFYNFDMRAALFDAGAFRGTTVSNWLDITVHVDNDNYDINALFKNIWPELARRMQEQYQPEKVK